MKKRKLNSKNPRYHQTSDEDKVKSNKVLINNIKGAKIYAVYNK